SERVGGATHAPASDELRERDRAFFGTCFQPRSDAAQETRRCSKRCRAAAVVLRCAVVPGTRIHVARDWYRRALPVPQSPTNPCKPTALGSPGLTRRS